jgi:hypothetical protein
MVPLTTTGPVILNNSETENIDCAGSIDKNRFILFVRSFKRFDQYSKPLLRSGPGELYHNFSCLCQNYIFSFTCNMNYSYPASLSQLPGLT